MNTIRTAIRSFQANWLYTLINLVGLILGFSFAIVLLIYVQFEFSFDKFHQDKNQIFRVNEIFTTPKNTTISPSIRVLYGPALVSEIPGLKSFVRLKLTSEELGWSKNKIKFDEVLFADNSFFQFFSFDLLSGNSLNKLNENEIVITKETANILFGEENPLGKTVLIRDKPFTVSAIAKDPPHNSHIRFDIVVPINMLLNSPDIYTGWDGGMSVQTFVKTIPEARAQDIQVKLAPLLWDKVNRKNEGTGFFSEFYLEPLTKIHLYSDANYDNFKNSDIKNVLTLLFISCIILLVAIINFIFISNGILIYRGKEFHIKRLLGSGKLEVIKQMFVENLMQVSVAVLLSLLFVFSIQHVVCPLFGYNFNFITGRILSNIIYLTLFCVTVSFFASLLSAGNYFKKNSIVPSNPLFKNTYRNKKLFYVSAIQFCLTIGLIASVIVIYKQLNYALTKDLGFTQENVIQITHPDIGSKKEILINEISKLSGVRNITASFGIPGLEATQNGYKPEGEDQWYMFGALYADENFIDTYGISLIQGRNFHKGESGRNQPYIINQTLANTLGWDNPIGNTIFRDGVLHEIIGVVEDFHVGLIYSKIPPLIISMEMQDYFYSLSIAIQSDQIKQTLSSIEKSWESIMPEVPFNYFFFDEKFESLYKRIQRTGTTILIFAEIAILISILGLFGISLLLINGKTKEIGIRKVNGAKVSEILAMLNKDFVKWILIAFIIATPIAYYAMNKWLENFAYKTELSWWIFALAGVLAMGIALLTVSWQSWRAARRNPVEALRYE